jgi:aryl-alcohol dehydrogenase-like predicted oxidoreductase
MQYRPFGSTGLTTSEVGFGCARIGGVFQGSSRHELLTLLRRSFDRGITLFDTADMYTQGESERLVGDAFHGHRHRVVIASKFGYCLPTQKRLVSVVKPLLRPALARLGIKRRKFVRSAGGRMPQDFSRAHITEAIEASLRRLRTDYIDIYQLHDPPMEVLRQGEFVEALEDLKQQGKIRCWGVAGQEPDDAIAALRYAPRLGAVQVGLNVLDQAALDAAIPEAAERGVAVIARQVFASGLLTRRVDQLQIDSLDPEADVALRTRERLLAYAAIADRCGRGHAELAMRFALARDDVSVVLLGISRSDQLSAALDALDTPSLSDEERVLLTTCRRSRP